MPRAVCALLCLFAAAAAAADFGALKPLGHVSDYAGVLRPEAVEELNGYCARVERATGVQMALVVLPSLAGEPVEDVANLLFRKWGVGQKQKNDGLLLLISVRDRRTRLEVGYGLEEVIPDGYAGWVLREMRPHLRAGDYRAALLAAAETLAGRIAEARGVKLDGAAGGRRAPAPEGAAPWWLLAAAGAAGLLLLVPLSRARRAARRRGYYGDSAVAWFLPVLWQDSGFPTRSSGGFGGFDSDDSFGGFGGGDSGGGGASGSW